MKQSAFIWGAVIGFIAAIVLASTTGWFDKYYQPVQYTNVPIVQIRSSDGLLTVGVILDNHLVEIPWPYQEWPSLGDHVDLIGAWSTLTQTFYTISMYPSPSEGESEIETSIQHGDYDARNWRTTA